MDDILWFTVYNYINVVYATAKPCLAAKKFGIFLLMQALVAF